MWSVRPQCPESSLICLPSSTCPFNLPHPNTGLRPWISPAVERSADSDKQSDWFYRLLLTERNVDSRYLNCARSQTWYPSVRFVPPNDCRSGALWFGRNWIEFVPLSGSCSEPYWIPLEIWDCRAHNPSNSSVFTADEAGKITCSVWVLCPVASVPRIHMLFGCYIRPRNSITLSPYFCTPYHSRLSDQVLGRENCVFVYVVAVGSNSEFLGSFP